LYPEIESRLHDELVRNYREHYLATAIGNTVLFPKVESTLEKLLAQGYQLAVATGKSRRGLDRAFQETRVGKYFQVSRCADETFSKPHPQMLYEIMESLDTSPGETIMVGDSEHDLQMAANASVSSIAVSYGARAIERLLEFNPETGIHCLSELPEWLMNTQ
ncbi:MAG: HAD-IA family hydrolase, partial [Gammaproteobacteria bacterium]